MASIRKGRRHETLNEVKEKLARKHIETSKRLAACIEAYRCLHPDASDEDATRKSKDYCRIQEGGAKEVAELEAKIKQMEENQATRKRKIAVQRRGLNQPTPASSRVKSRSKKTVERPACKAESSSDSDADDDERGDEEEANVKEIFLSHIKKTKESKLYMALQGLQSKKVTKRECNMSELKSEKTATSKAPIESVENNGRTFFRNKCYHYGGVIVGITGFYSKEAAQCVLVVPFCETFLGVEDEGVNYISTFEPSPYVRVSATLDPLPLKEFGTVATDVPNIPDLLYKPEVEGDWLHFAYFYNDKRKRIGKRTGGPIRMIDLFGGAGILSEGMHKSGFKTICAVEKNSKAAQAFKLNHPDALVESIDVNEWIKRCRDDPAYRKLFVGVGHVHSSCPCQGFSRANRMGGKNDKANNELSLTIVDVLKMFRPLTASFENVLGMWDRKNQHYLKNILVDMMKLGYQVRCCKLDAAGFGDPQARSRLIIFAAQRCSYLPDRPSNTHGNGTSMDYVTVEDALRGGSSQLLSPILNEPQQQQSDPNNHTPRLQILPKDEPAKTITASGPPPLHYCALLHHRPVTINEMKALFSLAPHFQLVGSEQNQRKQLGNSVPVELGAAIGRVIADVHKYKYAQEVEEESL